MRHSGEGRPELTSSNARRGIEGSSRRRRMTAVSVIGLLVLATVGSTPALAVDGASLTIIKASSPASDAQDFDFDLTGTGVPADLDLDTDAGDASLPSQQSFSLSSSQLGAYTVTESTTAGWSLTGMACNDPTNDSSVSLATRTATIDVDAGDTIVCTFTNTKALPVEIGTIGFWRNWRNHYNETQLGALMTFVAGNNPTVYGQAGNLLDASRIDAIYAFKKAKPSAQVLLAQLTALKLNLAASALHLNEAGEICAGGTVSVAAIPGASSQFGSSTPTVAAVVAWIESRWTGTLTTRPADWSFALSKSQVSTAQSVVESINSGIGVLSTGCP